MRMCTHVVRSVSRNDGRQLRLLREAVQVPEHEAAPALADAAVQRGAPEVVIRVPEHLRELHYHLHHAAYHQLLVRTDEPFPGAGVLADVIADGSCK